MFPNLVEDSETDFIILEYHLFMSSMPQLLFTFLAPWFDYIFHDWPVLILAIVAGILAHYIFYLILQAATPGHTTETIKFIFRKIRFPTLAAFILAAISIAINELDMNPDVRATMKHASVITLIIAITWSLAAGVKIFRQVTLRKYDVSQADNLLARKRLTQFRVLERIVIAVIVIFGAGAILMTFDTIRSLGYSLLASAGVAGIIIGFAAQRSIATFLAGIQIAITQPIRLEDAVVVEGEWGWIEEINFTYVVIRIWDQRRLVVPINYFIEKPFQNWTKKTAEILGTVYLYTDYTVPVDALREELDRILEGNKLWDERVKVIQVTDATEKTMEIRILVSAKNSPTAWDLRVMVREKIIKFLQENYPQSLPQTRVMFDKEDAPDLRQTPPSDGGKEAKA